MKLRHTILCAAMAATAALCGSTEARAEDKSLETIVAEANAVCPVKVDQGSSLDAVKLTADAVEIHLAMGIPAAQFPMIEQNMTMMRPTMLKMLSGNTDMREIFRMASQANLGLRIVILCSDDRNTNFALAYSAQELADAIK
ncbi:MAG: hypothetical protein K2L27_07540 [Muribaculaceae bacterium]|nr:hypothetical protein [Muribaculaceae bacterium]